MNVDIFTSVATEFSRVIAAGAPAGARPLQGRYERTGFFAVGLARDGGWARIIAASYFCPKPSCS